MNCLFGIRVDVVAGR